MAKWLEAPREPFRMRWLAPIQTPTLAVLTWSTKVKEGWEGWLEKDRAANTRALPQTWSNVAYKEVPAPTNGVKRRKSKEA